MAKKRRDHFSISDGKANEILPMIRQKSESQNGGNKKTKNAKISEKRTLLTH